MPATGVDETMTTPQITALPPAPTPQDSPEAFNDKAFRVLAAQEAFVEEANELAEFVNQKTSDAAAASVSAGQAAQSAEAARDDAIAAKNVVVGVASQFGDVGSAIAFAEDAAQRSFTQAQVAANASQVAELARDAATVAKNAAVAAEQSIDSRAEQITTDATLAAVGAVTTQVESARDVAVAAKDGAELARDAAIAAAGPLYATIEEGRAAVADGETFAVQGDGDVAAIVYRKIDAASSEAIASIASVSALEGIVTKSKLQSAYIPLASLGRKIVMWHEADGLNASEVSRGLKQKILKNTVSEFRSQSERKIPLLGFGRKIYAYLDETGVGFSSLSDKFKRNLYRELSEYSEHPIATDGRHLGMWRNKQALFNSGVADTKLRVGFVGDSWSEMNVIPGRFRKKLLDTYGIAGQGFRAVVSGNRLADTPSLTRSSEWVLYDGSSDSVLPYGTGVDGQSIVTDSASATLNLSGITGNLVKIFHRGYGGSFRYRTDGGPWVAVTAPNDSKNHTITVNIPGAGSHTIDIDTQGNSGAVVITGFYITGDGMGAEISKMGNGGLTGAYMNNWVGSIGDITPEIGIDLMIVFLGTNDYRSSSASVEKYTEALENLISAWRTAQPNIGFILCAPPQSNGTAITPLGKYRDAMYSVAKNKGCEFIDMLTLWGDFNVTDSLGMWNDNLHVSNIGAERLVLDVNNYFLKA